MHFSCGAALKARGLNIPYTVNGREPVASVRDSDRGSVRSEMPLSPSLGRGFLSGVQKRRVMTHHEALVERCLTSSVADIGHDHTSGLRSLAWVGVPPCMRGRSWRLLCDLLPPTLARREEEHRRRILQYTDLVARYGSVGSVEGSDIMRQLGLDLPRHKLLLFHLPVSVRALERVLFVWCLRHPAVGYVQGMDDIVTTFFSAFLAEAVAEVLLEVEAEEFDAANVVYSSLVCEDGDMPLRVATTGVSEREGGSGTKPLLERLLWVNGGPLSEDLMRRVEADTYWCAGKALGWTQDHFVNGLEGVHAIGMRVGSLLEAVDPSLSDYLQDCGVMISQATFQWHHCLLCRELPPSHALRLWDTYLSIGSGFAEFHAFVALAIVLFLKPLLQPEASPLPAGSGSQHPTLSVASSPTLDVLMDILKSPCRVVSRTTDPRVRVEPPVYWVDERIAEAFVLQSTF